MLCALAVSLAGVRPSVFGAVWVGAAEPGDTMSFADLIKRLEGLVSVVAELAPYSGVVGAMSRWVTSSSAEDAGGHGKGPFCGWPRPSDYLGVLGWDGRLSGDSQSGGSAWQRGRPGQPQPPLPAMCFVEAGASAAVAAVATRAHRDDASGLGLAKRRSGSAAAYVAAIALQGQVTTRRYSVHDLANAMTWATFPGLKWSIFGCLWQEVLSFENNHEAQTPGRGRSERSDRLTQLDEAGVLGGGAARVLFGHALLEHLMLGRQAQINAPLWLLRDCGKGLGLAERMVQTLAERGATGDLPTGTYPVGGPGVMAACGLNETCLQDDRSRKSF